LAFATAYWFYNHFYWVVETKEVGFQGAAKTNKLLAADYFLRKMGINSQPLDSLMAFRKLPSSQHTILIATQRETLNKQLSEKLLSWVKSISNVNNNLRDRSFIMQFTYCFVHIRPIKT